MIKIKTFATGLALAIFTCGVPSISISKDAPLGSADFSPSPERPVGWRGDGSGHFPGATPGLTWSLKDGKGTNIAWQAFIPFDSPSSVIVAGEKLFVTGNPYYLFCVEKRTGKILWARTVSPYDAATKEDRDANKELFDKLDQLAKKRDELLAQIPSPGTNGIEKLAGEIQKNSEEINKLFIETDKVKYKNTGMGWSDGGYMGSTPASDGKLVFAWNGWGVTACFDLEGNRKWIRFDQLVPQEHGHFVSPLLAGDLVVIHRGQQYLALDKKTGREAWKADWLPVPGFSAPRIYGSSVSTLAGAETLLITGEAGLIRVADGKQLNKGISGGLTPSPVAGGGFVFAIDGYGRTPVYYKLPEKTDTPFTPAIKGRALKINNADYLSSSPLYHDGLLYVVGGTPVLFVFDVAAEKLAYRQDLPFGEIPTRGDRPYGCGISASPALAGGRIFLTGNFGTTLVIEPGREYREAGRNVIDQRISYAYKTNMLEGTVSCPFFDGRQIFYRAQRYLYCIGEAVKP